MSYTPTQILNWAKIAQPMALVGEYGLGQKGDPDLHIKIYEERKNVQWFFDQCYANGGTPSTDQLMALYKACNYLFALLGIYGIKAQGFGLCIPPIIILNPISQSLNAGNTLLLAIAVTGTTPITYQWQKDGVDITGATSSVYSKSNIVTGDAGSYTCTVINACGTKTSGAANISVAALLVAYYAAADVDPFATINGGTDPYSYNHSITFLHNANLAFPLADADQNRFLIFKVPAGESLKIAFTCAPLYPLNNGTIPGPAFRSKLNIGAFDYYLTADTFAYNTNTTIILTS